ncbi:adhesion G-protein coupled receptor F3-like [Mantella aurantiaca]
MRESFLRLKINFSKSEFLPVGLNINKSGYPAIAYIQVVPQNMAADDLQLVKTLLTSMNLTEANSSMEITRVQTSTECIKNQKGIHCSCQSGFHFDMAKCESYPSCHIPLEVDSYCDCPNMNSSSSVYCEDPPAIPGRVTLFPTSVTPGSDIRLEFSSTEDVTNIRWFMLNMKREEDKEIRNGTKATIVTSSRKSTLSIDSIPRNWEGIYGCRFKYRYLQWQASLPVKFPLQSADITRKPAHVLLWNNATNFSGVTIECCILNDGSSDHVFWEPGHLLSEVRLRGDQQCYYLSINTVPEQDTYYRCVFQNSAKKAVESGVLIAVIKDQDTFCSGNKKWKATKAGHETEILCPFGKRGRITRNCSRSGQWDSPKINCVDARLLSLLEEAQLVRGGLGSPDLKISGMIKTLRILTLSSQGDMNNSWDILYLVETLNTISLIALDSNIKFNFSIVSGLLELCSQMLDKSLKPIWMDVCLEHPSIASTFMQTIENLTNLFEPDVNIFNFYIHYPNVELDAVILNPLTFTGYNKTFNTTLTTKVYIKNVKMLDQVIVGKLLVKSMMLRNLGNILPTRFGDSVGGDQHFVSSRIVINSIMMSGHSFRQADLDMVFGRRTNSSAMETAVAQCVFWDYNLFGGVGGWSTEGCRTIHESNVAICRCNHLSSLSVLMSIIVLEDEVLETLSQVGVSLSILSLLICIIVYIIEWKTVVKDDISFYRQTAMINISLTVLIADAWFLLSTFIRESHENKLCIAAAFFQHFFYLASFFWKLFHGLILFHQMVFDFYHLARSIVILSMVLIGYICPFVIAIVTLILDYPRKAYIREGDCFLNGENGAVFAFSGPVLLITFMNFFVIGAVVWRTLRPKVSEDQEDDRKAMVVKAITILTSVYGVSWSLGTITIIEEAHEFLEYAFTLLNSFQGVIILIFGCLMDKKVREEISKWLPKFLSLFPKISSYNMEQSPDVNMNGVETYRMRADQLKMAAISGYAHFKAVITTGFIQQQFIVCTSTEQQLLFSSMGHRKARSGHGHVHRPHSSLRNGIRYLRTCLVLSTNQYYTENRRQGN